MSKLETKIEEIEETIDFVQDTLVDLRQKLKELRQRELPRNFKTAAAEQQPTA